MTAAVLAAPYVPPAPVTDPNWRTIRHTLTAWNNATKWDLSAPDGGVFLRRAGLRGLGLPPFTHQRDESPAVPGARYRETLYGPRSCFWPIHLFHDDTTEAWVQRDRAFWAALHPEHEATWEVTVAGSGTRRLLVRVQDDGDWAPELDPGFYGWADYGIALQADQPFWEGDPIPLKWDVASPPSFFGSSGSVVNIANNRNLASASVTNPGDVQAYPIWMIKGPCATATISVNGHSLVMPFALTTDQYIVLDTRPTEQTVTDHTGASRYADMGTLDWRGWIDPGATAALSLSVTGTTSAATGIEMSFVPHYLRAW